MDYNQRIEGTVKTTKLNNDCMAGWPIISKLSHGITRSRTQNVSEPETEPYIGQGFSVRGLDISPVLLVCVYVY